MSSFAFCGVSKPALKDQKQTPGHDAQAFAVVEFIFLSLGEKRLFIVYKR